MSSKAPFNTEVSFSSTPCAPSTLRDEYYNIYRPPENLPYFLQKDLSVERLNKKNLNRCKWTILAYNILDNRAANPKIYQCTVLIRRALDFHNWAKSFIFVVAVFMRLLIHTSKSCSATISPVTPTTIHIAVVLTAMQVGRATTRLSRNLALQRASYCFTTLSILGPLIMIVLVVFIGLPRFIINLVTILRFKQEPLLIWPQPCDLSVPWENSTISRLGIHDSSCDNSSRPATQDSQVNFRKFVL